MSQAHVAAQKPTRIQPNSWVPDNMPTDTYEQERILEIAVRDGKRRIAVNAAFLPPQNEQKESGETE